MTRTTLFAISLFSVVALGQTSCGDSSSVNPRGGLSLWIGPTNYADTPDGMACNGIYTSAAIAFPDANQAPTASSPGVAVANGDAGYEVTCSVSASGDGYDVSLRIQDGDTTFTMRGLVNGNGEGTAVTASVSRSSWAQDSLRTSAQNGLPCTLTVSDANSPYYVERGAVYGQLVCPVVTSAPSAACRLQGHVFFERCSG